MIGYPYTYGDYLSEEKAMERRVKFVDGALVAIFIWSLKSYMAHAQELPIVKPGDNTPGVAPGANFPVFAPIAGMCKCTSPQVKTAILLLGVTAICYSALCSDDKPLMVACGSLATYAATKLKE